MRHFMQLIGMGTALLAAHACGGGPTLPLAVVAARNAVATVRQLLAEGHPADERDDGGLTPLMWAARHDAVEAMSALFDGGADPNARDHRNGWTPLLHAIHRRHVDAVRVLLERGADPNQRNGLLTPLLMAAPDPDATFVKLLLSYGADPTVRGSGGSTALSEAVSGERCRISIARCSAAAARKPYGP